MKYCPTYQFVNTMYVETIVLDCSEGVTLLARFGKENGISSLKHVFCDTSELGKLLMEPGDETDMILEYIVFIIENDLLEDPEEIDVEFLLGGPITFSNYRLRVYNPLVESAIEGQLELNPDLFELDRIMPKLS